MNNQLFDETKKENYIKAKELYLSGMSLTEIEKTTGYSRKKLSKVLKFENISVVKNNQKYVYNTEFFKKIDTQEKAYWLGFLYADSYINDFGKYELDISLSAKDIEHLEKLESVLILDGGKKIKKFESKFKGKTYSSCELLITNKEMVLDLIQLGCIRNKSEDLTLPSWIDKSLLRHFIRGYFDGNGTVVLSNNCLSVGIASGNKDFLLSINKVLHDELNIVDSSQSHYIYGDKRSNNYDWKKGSIEFNQKFYSYLYSEASIFLQRKKDKFEEYFTIKNIKYSKLPS